MKKIINHSETELKNKSGYWTAKEIEQQPVVWQKVANDIIKNHGELSGWLEDALSKPLGRIILTGAGTSAYVGETLAPFLSKKLSRPFEAISTTDIVSAPEQFLFKEKPTLIISYARSGNSPESVAACELCDQFIDNTYHLIITCNKDGMLAKMDNIDKRRYVLLMPEETNDKSFAMTSSFSSMLLATALIFNLDNRKLEVAIKISNKILSSEFLEKIEALSQKNLNRVVCLGCGGLLGYTQQYDSDLLKEVKSDRKAENIINLLEELGTSDLEIDDLWLAFPYILYCQILAFNKSLALNITPDNPCPTGEANRVVQGVKIYPYVGN
jgi:tagatose-6-phosphate ketose/aldose isomerase